MTLLGLAAAADQCAQQEKSKNLTKLPRGLRGKEGKGRADPELCRGAGWEGAASVLLGKREP